jgi:hypothetical protein
MSRCCVTEFIGAFWGWKSSSLQDILNRGDAGREKKSTFGGLSTTQVVETWLGENDFSRFFLTTA